MPWCLGASVQPYGGVCAAGLSPSVFVYLYNNIFIHNFFIRPHDLSRLRRVILKAFIYVSPFTKSNRSFPMSSRHQLPSIQVWIDTVTAETQRDIEQQNNQTQPASITRNRPLAPTSSNPRLGKRKQVEPATRQNPPRSCKRVKTMPTTRSNAGTNDENLTQNRRGSASRRGRPQGGGPVGRQVEGRGRGRGEISGPGQEPQRVGRIEITSRGRDTGLGRVQGRGQDIGGAQEFSVAAPSVVFAPPSQSSSQARARSTSPTKRGKTTIDKEKPDAKIQLVDLESCEPSVHLRSRARVIQGGELPPMVAKLDDLLHVKHGRFIPLQLKVSRIPLAGHYLVVDVT